jgi:hypothetical protein
VLKLIAAAEAKHAEGGGEIDLTELLISLWRHVPK